VRVYAVNYNVLRIMSGKPHRRQPSSINHHAGKSYMPCVSWELHKGKPFRHPRQLFRCSPVASASCKKACARFLVVRETPESHNYQVSMETSSWPRVMNLGMVIMLWIGQPACLRPKGAMLAYGRASETERKSVCEESLSNLSRLKIQSEPLGKLKGVFLDGGTCIFQLGCLNPQEDDISSLEKIRKIKKLKVYFVILFHSK
jgi:hypothetical protein